MAELIVERLNLDALLGLIQPQHVETTVDEGTEEKVSAFEFAEENGVIVPASPAFDFTLLDIVKKAAINLVLPFINGIMLGFGEIAAHELGFRYNWSGARVHPPLRLHAQAARSKFL